MSSTITRTTTVGGTASASGIKVAKIGHGLMTMTWAGARPDEETFASMKTSIDAVPDGVKMVFNAGEFYGYQRDLGNLELVARFFEKYPADREKVLLSVKGAIDLKHLQPDSSPENLQKSVETINGTLRGMKHLDLFECARVDPKRPVEETVKDLAKMIEEGKFSHIGLSECKAETLRRAHAVHPIAMVEIEVSPWSYEEETKKVIAAAKELGVIVLAYSPLGRGFLTGQFKQVKDMAEDDWRKHMTRFQNDEIIKHNYQLVEKLTAIATKKGITPGQLSLAWVSSLGDHVIPLPGSSKASRTLENIQGAEIVLTPEEVAEITEAIESFDVKGDRYYGDDKALHLWG